MTTITVVAVIGWLLFLVTILLYWVGNRLNAKESNSLATYSLALMLSDEFRSATQAGFNAAIREARSRGSTLEAVTYGLVEAITQNAKSCYKAESDISTISIVTTILATKQNEH